MPLKRSTQAMMVAVGMLILLFLCSLLIERTVGPGSNSVPVNRAYGQEQVLHEFAAGELGLSPPQEEVLTLGPQAVFATSNAVFVLDSLNQRVLQIDRKQPVLTSTTIAITGFFHDLVVRNDRFYLLDLADNAVQVVNNRGQVDETYPFSSIQAQAISGVAVTSASEVRLQVRRERELPLVPQSFIDTYGPAAQIQVDQAGLSVLPATGTSLRTTIERASAGEAALNIVSMAGQPLRRLTLQSQYHIGTMQLLQIDSLDRAYVLVEVLLPQVPAFVVATSIYRFEPDGSVSGIAAIPTESVSFLPQRYVSVSPDGEVYFLRVQGQAADVINLAFQPPDNYQPDLEERWAALQADPPPPANTEPIPFAAQVPDDEIGAVRSNITRAEIMANANAYLYANWVLGDVNYAAGNLSCDDTQWALPGYLADRRGETIAEVAYQWGGYSRVDQFLAGIAAGRLAGDACTCNDPARNYCLNYTRAVGVDCSGFVSRVWETGRYTTRNLNQISRPINWDNLKPGDVVNWPGSHVMLFNAFGNGGLHGPEAASDCNWRVCYAFRSYAHLNGRYTPLRYENVQEVTPTPTPPRATPTPQPQPEAPYNLEIIAGQNQLQPGESTLISAILRDAVGRPLETSRRITFTASLGSLTPTSANTDANFFATVTYQAPEAAAMVLITATSGIYSDVLQLEVGQLQSLTPRRPSNPSPAHEQINVSSAGLRFSWQSGNADSNPVTYTFTLSPADVAFSGENRVETFVSQARMVQLPLTLDLRPNQDYRWHITATYQKQNIGGPVWTFRTAGTNRIYLPLLLRQVSGNGNLVF